MSYSFESVPGDLDKFEILDEKLGSVAVCPDLPTARMVAKALDAYQANPTAPTESVQDRLL